MEYLEALKTSIEVLMNIWSCIGEFVKYKENLDENMQTLRKNIKELSSLEEDINTRLEKIKYLVREKQKKEVESWLENVKDKRREAQDIEQKFPRRRYFSRSRFLRLVEKTSNEVIELIAKGKTHEEFLNNVREDEEVEMISTHSVGQSRYITEIWKCLMNDGIISIGVCGMGGIGKTNIVKQINNELFNKRSHISDSVYWVTVSHESNVPELQDSIAKLIHLNFLDVRDEKIRAAKLKKELEKRKKFVLILDDMWQALLPEDIGIPIGVDAGKLIVTTRSSEVCQKMDCQQIIKVKPLSEEESWDLFMKKLGHETMLDPRVQKIAKDITKECAGLPLAIITIAGSMKGVGDFHQWRSALKELRDHSQGLIDMENKVFKILKFSYDRLNNETLQQCLLYCALFPEYYEIDIKYLIMCWIAEGLIDEMTTREAEFDMGHALLNKLEYSCLLERTTDFIGKMCVKMHDVIRDMALNITRVKPQFMVKAGEQLKELPNEKEWSENLERVSLMRNDIKHLPCISPKCPRLRTLILQSNFNIKEIPSSLFVYMQNLGVLDLSKTRIERLPDSISNLDKLRALLLNSCESLRHVPSLAKLTELRELDLWWTSIAKLPHGMEELVNLKRLDHSTYNANILFVLPSGLLHKLSRLQSLRLGTFKITHDLHVEEISSLTQLEVLGACFNNLDVFKGYIKRQHWQRLSQYNLQAGEGWSENDIRCREVHMIGSNLIGGGREDPLVLPTNMQELKIRDYDDFKSLSDISSSLKNARELERCWIDHCDGIEHLWSWYIPSLEEEEESEWCTNTSTSTSTSTSTTLVLQSLRTLVLQGLQNLSVIFNFKGVGGAPPKCGTFSNLKLLIVSFCGKIKYLFTSRLVQHHLQNLELIDVWICHEVENIILAEEEENQKEIVAAKEYDDNKSLIMCPKLETLVLHGLPKLKSIWSGTMVCHSLQQIDVKECPMLRRLPLSLQLNDGAHTSSTLLTLKKISGVQDWWDSLEWDHPDAKSVFQPVFEAEPKNTYQKYVGMATYNFGVSRLSKIWRQDAERYEK